MGEAKSVAYAATILKNKNEVYQFWRNWQNLPKFSRDLKSVVEVDDRHTRWTAEGPSGDITWDAETTEDIPGQKISWTSTDDSALYNSGSVEFEDAPMDRGTEVVVRMAYKAPGGVIGDLVAKVTGNSPEATIAESLRRFKAILECGELPIVEGQPSNQMRHENMPGDESKKVGMR